MSFIVLTYGATGSRWLARALDTAPGWRVLHEPFSKDLGAVQWRMDRYGPKYGEVNPKVRHLAFQIERVNLGVLIREPFEMALSAFNRHPDWLHEKHWDGVVADLALSLNLIRRAIREGAPLARIEEVGSDPRALANFAARLGVDGFDSSAVDWQRDHAHGRRVMADLGGLGPERYGQVAAILRPFAEEFYGRTAA